MISLPSLRQVVSSTRLARSLGPRALGLVMFAVVATAAGAQPAASVPACAPRDGQDAFRQTLPLDVLSFLETLEGSPFARAYVIGFLAAQDASDDEHWTVRCSRHLVEEVGLAPSPELRETTGALRLGLLLRALETAEADRLAATRQSETLGPLALDLLSELGRTDRGLVERSRAAAAAAGRFEAARLAYCQEEDGGGCIELAAVSDALAEVARLQGELRSATDARDRAEQDADDLASTLGPIRPTPADLDGQLAEIRQRLEAHAPCEPDEEECMGEEPAGPEVLSAAEVEALEAQRDSLASVRTALDSLVRAEGRLATAEDSVSTRREALEMALQRSRVPLAALTEEPGIVRVSVGVPEGASAVADVSVDVPSAGELAASPRAAAPANLALAFTDFLLERAKGEGVLALVSRLYDVLYRAEGDSTVCTPTDGSGCSQPARLAQIAFADTRDLMAALNTSGPNDFRAREAALVPIATWRAALASDFARVADRITIEGSAVLCEERPDIPACTVNLASAGLVLHTVRQLYDGAEPLAALRSSLDYARRAEGTAGLADWDALRSGLGLLEGVWASVEVQRGLPTDLTATHPYLLSPETLVRIRRPHAAAFLRLLVAEAGPAPGLALAGRAESLEDRVFDVVVATDALMRAFRPEGGEVEPRAVMRGLAGALLAGAQLADDLAVPGDASLEAHLRRWERAAAVADAFAAGDYARALSESVVLVQICAPEALPRSVVQLSSLASALAAAETEADARAAFSAAASPLGGWDAKRYGDGSPWTLTSYLGGGGGAEFLLGAAEEGGVAIAPSALVGIEWTAAQSRLPREDPTASFGVFASLLDFGGLLSYRIGSIGRDEGDSVEVDPAPNVTFAQVFAPGLHLAFGLPKAPVSVLLGAQLAPALRSYTRSGAEKQSGVVQLRATVAFDLVLLDF